MRRWPGLTRLADRAWDRYDRLGDWQRVGLGVGVALALAASLLYTLGAASLIALSRYPPSASAEAPPESPTPTLLPIATDVNPISPLLAERTPTLRPTATRTPAGGVPLRASPSPTLAVIPRAAATATPSPGTSLSGLATPTRTPTRGAAPPTPTPTRSLR